MGVCISQLHRQDGEHTKTLSFTSGNEGVLNEMLSQIMSLPAKHQDESTILFETPLTWTTSLTADLLGEAASSGDKRPNGKHVCYLADQVIHVSNFDYAVRVLQAAGDHKLAELRKALEANPDPIANILGSAYGDGADTISVHQQQKKGASEEDDTFFRLLLALHALDVQLLRLSVEQLNKETRVNMQTAEAEVAMLHEIAGIDDNDSLENIDWESSVTFSNGLRAPPWRQVHGDLGYIIVKASDVAPFYVVANVNGFWQIKGPGEGGAMDDEKIGDTYATLSALLRAKSPHFAATIDSHSFKEKQQTNVMKATLQKEDLRKYLEADDDVIRASTMTPSQAAPQRTVSRQHKNKKKRKLQPSARWASLGLDIPSSSSAAVVSKKKVASAKPQAAPSGTRRKKSAANSREMSAFFPKRTLEPPKSIEEFSESDEGESEEDVEERRMQDNELPVEYWQVQKLVKYLSGGNQTATVISLCLLRDMDPSTEVVQFALRDGDGLDVLMNLLDTEDVKCKIGALQILKEVTKDVFVKKSLADMNGVRALVQLLDEEDDELRGLAGLTIANCVENPRNRRMFRFYGGIDKAVAILSTAVEESNEELARCSATALWASSRSPKNKEYILKAGAVELLAKLLTSENVDLLIPVVGVLEECASDPVYRDLIRTHRMIPFLVTNLSKENKELQTHSSMTIFKCAEDAETRALVRECGGLEPLVKLLVNVNEHYLLEGATGAIWKCSVDPLNVKTFTELKAVELLVALLKTSPETVQTNVAGALAALATVPDACKQIRTTGGIEPLVKLLTSTNNTLLVNVTAAVGTVAKLKDNMDAIDKLDGVRLLWSLLKSSDEQVQASAAWAISPCIENARDAGELVRSFVGGVELVVRMLNSENKEVLAAICAAIAQIAKDEENLAVITDHGVVPMLCNLVNTTHDKLRQHLAEAVANCCAWGSNRTKFGEHDAVAPLNKFFRSKKEEVHISTARALFELSKDPENCVTMHKAGVVPHLLDLVGSADETAQLAAASCLANIRRLALCNELHHYG